MNIFFKKMIIAFAFFPVVTQLIANAEQNLNIANTIEEKLHQEIDKLDEQEEYEEGYRLIADKLRHDNSMYFLQYAVRHANEHYLKLLQNTTKQEKSIFTQPKCVPSGYVSCSKGWIATSYIINGNYYENYSEGMVAEAEKINFDIVDTEKALSVLEQYDILQENVKFYSRVLREKKYPFDDSDNAKQDYLSLKKEIEKIKDALIENHCKYLSYVVVSPCFAEAEKHIYIAQANTWARNDRERINRALVLLTHACHKKWLSMISEDVRMQFYEVTKSLKESVGSAEWEEYKLLATLLDSNDDSKQIGATVWWKEE